jgi:cobalt/nickel transport system permease protein
VIGRHLDAYVEGDSALHRADPRAKLIALAGFLTGVGLAPMRPVWAWAGLLALLGAMLILGRVPGRVIAKRFAALSLVLGVPFALTRLGGEQTRLAGEVFAIKSLLVAGAFVPLTATTSSALLVDSVTRVPGLRGLGVLMSFIIRGVHVLVGEVIRTNRAWSLRAPTAGIGTKLAGMTAGSVNLLGRAAARSERVGAAMVLRGFDGRMPTPAAPPLAWSHAVVASLFGLLCIAMGAAARWL